MKDPNWYSIEPITSQPSSHTDDKQIRSVIYVNNNLPSFSFSPILTNSRNLAGVKLSLSRPHPPISFISAYIPPGQAETMALLNPVLMSINRSPVIIGMDSNLHHMMWNPPGYDHTHREAHDLIQLMTDHGLLLRSEPGVPTHFSNNRQGSETTIDLQWHSPACYEWATVCKTETTLTHSHFSDHAAIITELSIPGQSEDNTLTRFRPNWALANWPRFTVLANEALQRLSLSLRLTLLTQEGIDNLATQVENTIVSARQQEVPLAKISPKTRRWWDPSVLSPLKGHALNLRRIAQRSKANTDKIAYRAAQAKFQKAVKDSKRHHWQLFLENLTEKDLFTAARYCDGPPTSCLLPPLRQAEGSLTDDPKLQAELLFQATGGPTINRDLSDVDDLTPPSSPPDPFSRDDITARISSLKLGKALGADGITSQVLNKCGEGLPICLPVLINACLNTGFYPSHWKTANTIILKKPGKPDYNEPSVYRPLALLSTLSKVLEGAIAYRIQTLAEKNASSYRRVITEVGLNGQPQTRLSTSQRGLRTSGQQAAWLDPCLLTSRLPSLRSTLVA